MPAHRIHKFDTWQPGYGGATVTVYIAGGTTKASLFSDQALTVAVGDNPQTLDTQVVDDVEYGRFLVPLYTASDYYLDIDGEQTGVEQAPITTLAAEDASDAVVTPTGGSVATAIDDIVARVIHAEDYGAIGSSAATNTTTITAAIGVAAGVSGGIVILPSGTIPFNQLTVSARVRGRGQGSGVTVLQSEVLDNCITLDGDDAGLEALTLDGVDLGTGSVGIFSKANDETAFHDVLVKRFETGIHYKGGRRGHWRDLSIDNCASGAKLHGDTDAGGGADGDAFRNNEWDGGRVTNCTTVGIELSFEDALCINNRFRVNVDNNTGTAININGARYTSFDAIGAVGNTTFLAVDDDDDTDNVDLNTVIGLVFKDGTIEDGAATFTGTNQDVIFDRCEIKDLDISLTSPTNPVLARDCTEDADVTISGDGEYWTRDRSIHRGAVTAITADDTATKIWEHKLNPGEACIAVARVMARQRNGEDNAWYYISVGASRDGSELDYDAQTANFTLGDIVTGGTSGATGRIVADSDSGATGTLTLIDIAGVFENDETITDDSGGSATANGTLTGQACALNSGGVNSLDVAVEDDANYACVFAANGNNLELQVTGVSGETVEWTAHVDLIAAG